MKPFCHGRQKWAQSAFSKKYACWAHNHLGWQKMKKKNNKIARKKIKRDIERYEQ